MNKELSILFESLNSSTVKYFLLTDFESEFISKDIDLFVSRTCRKLFENTLQQLGWYKRREPAYHLNHHFYYSPNSEIYLDVKYALSFTNHSDQCYTYRYTEEAIAESVLNSKGIYRPADQDAVILYAAHLAYKERGKLEEKHQRYLCSYIKNYKLVGPPFQEAINAIANWMYESFPDHTNGLQTLLDPFFHCASRRMVKNKKINFGWGVNVLFLGTDGAGKSTVIKAVRQKVNFKTNSLYLGLGENGWSSPIIKNFYNYKVKAKTLNSLLSFLKTYVVVPIEFIFRILSVKLKSRYSVLLIDRVPGSFLLERNIIKRSIYKLIIPKTDIVFFLYAEPCVLAKRKPDEITLEHSKADINKFRKVAAIISGGNYISIDTSQMTISETSDLVFTEIYKSSKVYEKLLTTKFN